jgi:hypothetical protein
MDAPAEALNLAAQGVPVFPVKLCREACLRCNICKAPATPHGFKDASADTEQIRTLWRRYPGQLVGTPTGKTSGFDVFDVDSSRHAEAVAWWLGNQRRIPATRAHQTGSGGLHVLFRHNELARTGTGRLATGVDVKANGGYIVWWPAFGRKVVRNDPICDWPNWLIAKQQPKPLQYFLPRGGSTNKIDPLVSWVASLREGERNCGAFWGFCRVFEAVAAGIIDEAGAVNLITAAALSTGLTDQEVRGIARNARLRARK